MTDNICPNCNSINVNNTGDPDIYDHKISLEWVCSNCETNWYANYKWTHNYDIKTVNKKNWKPIGSGKLLSMQDLLDRK